MDFILEPHNDKHPPLVFSFDEETQLVGGPDADFVFQEIEVAKKVGYAACGSGSRWPLGERIRLIDLTAMLGAMRAWRVSPPLPPLPRSTVPVDDLPGRIY